MYKAGKPSLGVVHQFETFVNNSVRRILQTVSLLVEDGLIKPRVRQAQPDSYSNYYTPLGIKKPANAAGFVFNIIV